MKYIHNNKFRFNLIYDKRTQHKIVHNLHDIKYIDTDGSCLEEVEHKK